MSFKLNLFVQSIFEFKGVRASFWILHSKFNITDSPGFLPKNAVKCIIEIMNISEKRKKRIIKKLFDISYCIQTSPDISSFIELEQYERLFLNNFNGVDDGVDDPCAEVIAERLLNESNNGEFFMKLVNKTKKVVLILFESRIYTILMCMVTIINIAVVSAELEVLNNPFYKIDNIHRKLSVSYY